jgi:hypothetical protein
VSASGRSLVKRSPTEYGVSECDREVSILRRPWPTRGFQATGKKLDKRLTFEAVLRRGEAY